MHIAGITVIVISLYFALLMLIAHLLRGKADNETFFRGNRQSPWYWVAFGMIGASLSGVSFVSVPGFVGITQMTYLQMCLGFFFGYLVVAFVLLPLYYRLNLTTIYGYLGIRFGRHTHRTGTLFFLLSKLVGAASRFYIVCFILQQFVFDAIGLPFEFTITLTLFLVWLYTRRAGIRVIVYTDALQTFFMLAALVALLWVVCDKINVNVDDIYTVISGSGYGKIFEWEDWSSKQYFWKQFLSGIFIVIVMTGLDQDMMQKNLTIARLKDAQKDMCLYGFSFIPVNLLFLLLGVLLYVFVGQIGMPLPSKPDDLLPMIVSSGVLGSGVLILFTIGVVAAAFSSVDSALTSLTTTYCLDILRIDKDAENKASGERTRYRVHMLMVLVFVVITLLFNAFNDNSVIDTLFVLASYTYGPLLGFFAFGLYTKRQPRDILVPVVAIASPILCYGLSIIIPHYTGYNLGYELLMVNGLLTFLGLWLLSMYKSHA